MAGTRENGPLLSRVVDPPGTKGGPRAGNFPGPPKNPFCPGWWLHPGQKAPPYISFLPPSPFPQTLVSFGAAAVRSPAPPTARAQHPRAPPPSTSPPRAPASTAAVDVRHPGPDPAAQAQHPRAPPTSCRRPEPRRVLRLAPPSLVCALAVHAPRAALALPLQRPAGAALTLMCFICLNLFRN